MPSTAPGRVALRLALAAICTLLLGSASPLSNDILLEVDLERFELRAIDQGEPGPRIRVATGTPYTPTPRGHYELTRLIANPSYTPGPDARRRGLTATAPSASGPLGVAKIPFKGAFQLHGGGHRYGAGMPVTLGCVQLTDPDMKRLAAWLEQRGALGTSVPNNGELVRPFVRRARLHIH